MNIQRQNITAEIIGFLLVLLFVYAAFSKLFEYNSFQKQLHNSPLVSSFSKAAWTLPAAEIIITILLSVKVLRLAGFYFSLLMMSAFTFYVAGMLLFEKHLPCSCGGVLQHMGWKQHLVFNIFFLAISGWGISLQRKINLTSCTTVS